MKSAPGWQVKLLVTTCCYNSDQITTLFILNFQIVSNLSFHDLNIPKFWPSKIRPRQPMTVRPNGGWLILVRLNTKFFLELMAHKKHISVERKHRT